VGTVLVILAGLLQTKLKDCELITVAANEFIIHSQPSQLPHAEPQ
jgi:hypothetical protein